MYDKPSDEVYAIFEKLAQNSRHKNSRRKRKGLYAVDANTENSIQLSQIMKRMDALATDVRELKQQRAYVGEHQIGGPGPGEEEEEEEEEVHAMNNYNPRPQNDPYSNT